MGDDTATQQQHAGWRNTYREHVFHVRHLAHVPVKVLIEGGGTLQRSEGRFTVWSDIEARLKATSSTTTQRHIKKNKRDEGTRTLKMLFISTKEFVVHPPMG
jgi:hypothetical protein